MSIKTPLLLLLSLLLIVHHSFGQKNGESYTAEAKRYYEENKVDSAILSAHKALECYPETPSDKNHEAITAAYTFLAQLYIAKGEHKESLQYFNKAMDIAQKYNDIASVAKCQHTISNAMFSMGENELALNESLKSYQTAISINDYNRAAASQLTAASICNALKRYIEAVEHSKLTIKYGMINDDNPLQIGCGWHVMAGALFELKEYDQTLKSLSEALRFYQKSENKTLVPVVENAIAYVKTLMGDNKLKDSVMTDALERVKSKDANKAIGNQSTDSLSEGDKNSYENIKLEKMLADYNALEKTTKFEILQQDYFERQADTLRQRIGFVSGLALLAIAALALLYGRQRQKTKSEQAIRLAEQKEAEFLALKQETDQRLIRNYIDGLESERARISKELHDGICNDILALELDMRAMGLDVQKVQQLTRARESVRDISHELLPPQFQYASIDEILADYAQRLKPAKNGVVVYRSQGDNDWSGLSKEIAFAIYRIVQEAVSNSMKHSAADQIKITLSKSESEVSIDISDNGIGFDGSKKVKGVGLRTARERVQSVGGKFCIETNRQGTILRATFKI